VMVRSVEEALALSGRLAVLMAAGAYSE
jgi:hypothetical protein